MNERDLLFIIGAFVGAVHIVAARWVMRWSVRWANSPAGQFFTRWDSLRTENERHLWYLRAIGAAILLVSVVGLAVGR